MEQEFKRPCLEDKSTIDKILLLNNDINSESAFGTSYIWSDMYDIKIYLHKGVLLKKIDNKYAFPKGMKTLEDIEYNINFLKSISDGTLHLTELLKHEVEALEKVFPGKFKFVADRNNFEYIYSIKDLSELKGKKYHSKRNHISKFNKLYKWKYYSKIDKDESIDFFKKWFQMNTHEEMTSCKNEYNALCKALDGFNKLKLCVGAIKVADEMIACTIGEKINNDTLLVHFEKALPNFEGAYSVINNEFCKAHRKEYKLVNREEDMGILGLRKSKLSYKPKLLLQKYSARWSEA